MAEPDSTRCAMGGVNARLDYSAPMPARNSSMMSDRNRRILTLALPIIGGMTSQNLLNLVDTAMVGALGAAPLAAVGIGSFLSFMSVAVVIGLATAVQALAARRYGEGLHEQTAVPLNGGLILALLLGAPIAVALYLLAPWVFALMTPDAEVVAQGTPYFQMRLLSVVAVGMNFAFRGYWNAVDLARLYLYTLLIMHAVNVVLNYCLIFGHFGAPALGTLGAGLGTTISNWLGTIIYFAMAMRLCQSNGFLHQLPAPRQLVQQLRLGLPSSVQQFLFSAGLTAFFWIMAQVGTRELAVSNVLINITLVAILPGIGLGLAAATLVGHALGRGNAVDAHRWVWEVCRVGLIIFVLLALPMLLLPDLILGLFLHDASLVEAGRLPLRIVGATIALDGIGLIVMHGLLGAGATGQVMTVAMVLQWLLFLPAAWIMVNGFGLGLVALWSGFVGYRCLQTLVFAYLWQQRGWTRIRI